VTASREGFPGDGQGLLRQRLALWLDDLLGLLFPSRCAGCGRPGPAWCAACEGRAEILAGPLCPGCGQPGHRSAGCRHAFPFPVRSYARYRGPIARALLHLKYRPNRALAEVMGRWLATLVRREAWQPTLILPVPLAPDRLRRRGYNQAALIAQSLASHLDLPCSEAALTRIRETRSQVGLDGTARRSNVAGAFQAHAETLGGSRVCIVDDLCTTGATLAACGQACAQAGALRVYGLTVGRAG
jgi:ComF family protein